MAKPVEEDDYWNTSENKGFDFDGDRSAISTGRSRGEHYLFTDDNTSESSYELPKNEIPLNLIISNSDLQIILEEQSMEEFTLPKSLSPEEEIRVLRRMLLEKSHAPLAYTTISRILLGKPCSLEHYKSLREKEELLDEAIASGNGDAILAVLLFVVKTLKKSHLNRILQTRPEAVNHYLNYLTLRLQISEATDLLTMLGRNHEAAIMQFHVAVNSTSNISIRKQKLKQIYSTHFTQPGSNTFYSQMLANYINLLEWQSSEKSKGSEDVLNTSVLRSLYFTSQMQSPALTSQQFADIYSISAAHFEWISLNERAKSQAWLDIEPLFQKKSWTKLKTKSFQIHIPLERAILQLHALSAPPAILNQFLMHVDDATRRLMLARRVHAVRSEIDSLVMLKDKISLETLRDNLEAGCEERFYAENAIKNLNSKWKTDGIKLIKN